MKYRVEVEGHDFEIEIDPRGRIWLNNRPLDVDMEQVDGLPQYSLLVDHRSYEAVIEGEEEGECRLVVAGRPYRARFLDQRRSPARTDTRHQTEGTAQVTAPLPGLLVEVRVEKGQRVEEGDPVAVLESMKMHLELRAPRSGIVQAVHKSPGTEVAQGDVLVTVVPPPSPDGATDRRYEIARAAAVSASGQGRNSPETKPS